jgi:Spy/CpxP family protein refolding chaperone
MTTLRKQFIMTLSALSLGAAAFGAQAQTNAAPASAPQAEHGEHADHGGHHRMPSPEQMAAFRAKRIAHMHDSLMITPAQETAWNRFVASMQPASHPKADQADRNGARAAMAHLTAPQRMAKMIEMQKQHTAALEQRQGALSSFYAVLSPEQKKVFDERAAHMRGHGGRPGMHGDWQHGGGGMARG